MTRPLAASLLVGGASLTAIALVVATAALSAPAFANDAGATPYPLSAAASKA
ncbi:hypothetical protein [Paraburkholderia rhizosphaerae]|uniref:Uncharacterized protein n=1 Tax=Paraburkholderia rhizosphaerae TaxID=480658 RepID=A0A4R8LGJ7_9BURK|nr:hypothetical protein [Paraburkholderia rhizosphaerae]TDY42253.1 hypothetical protein BX592_12262 [Paraburkholderia rhizosphaerae]